MSTKKSKNKFAAPTLAAVSEPSVVTYTGDTYPKSACRRIDNDYYLIGDKNIKDSGQVFLINDVWYRLSTNKITWDYRKEEYVIISSSTLIYGLVDVTKDKEPVMGYFTPDDLKDIMVYDYGASEFMAMDENMALKLPNAVRCVSDGAIVFSKLKNVNSLSRFEKHAKRNYPSFDLNNYGFANNPGVSLVKERNAKYIKSKEFTVNPTIAEIAKFLKGYTFGAEFETACGTLPTKELLKTGLIPVKDGSISGHEYVTLVHQGELGLQLLMDAANALSTWTTPDQYCSLHIHIGNVPRTKEFIIAMYMLSYMLQHELHEIVAPYKKDVGYLASKNHGAKDHCKYLQSLNLFGNRIYDVPKEQKQREIDVVFKNVFAWLNDGQGENVRNNFGTGVHVRQDRPKWEWQSRYYWMNFCNLVFSPHHTVENRLHSGTVNPTKTLNWLLITVAMIDFAINNQEEIIRGKTKYALEDIVNRYYRVSDSGNIIADYLLAYIRDRKNNFFNLSMMGDMYGNEFVNKNTSFEPWEVLIKRLK